MPDIDYWASTFYKVGLDLRCCPKARYLNTPATVFWNTFSTLTLSYDLSSKIPGSVPRSVLASMIKLEPWLIAHCTAKLQGQFREQM